MGRRRGGGRRRLPRSRGDGPQHSRTSRGFDSAAPLTRGWTHDPVHTIRRGRGCPAHAGMDPECGANGPPSRWLPRSRGDGPCCAMLKPAMPGAAPLTRGWTPPALGRDRRPRGCPAHAGMDPYQVYQRGVGRRLPRSRGDGPSAAAAGYRSRLAAPLTRGWTRQWNFDRPRDGGCPAHAGMDRQLPRRRFGVAGLPRSRGDGPSSQCGTTHPRRAAPLTRGWTPRRAGRASPLAGCPAHAGMDRAAGSVRGDARGLPRSRGDGPVA